jgi:hypothetical protein
MSKMQLRKNKGWMVVEASVIMPLIIGVVFIVIYGFVYILNREAARSEMYSAIYSISITDMDAKEYSFSDSREQLGSQMLWCEPRSAAFGLDGTITYITYMDMKGTTTVTAQTETGLCTQRLRRWQLYGNLAEK